jgi:hypothetical protein
MGALEKHKEADAPMPEYPDYDQIALRESLRYLRRQFTTQGIIGRLCEDNPDQPPVSVGHLNKFISQPDGGAKKINLKAPILGKLREYAMAHHPEPFSRPSRVSSVSPGLLGAVLTGFFGSNSEDDFDIEYFRECFPGTYVMYRPNWALEQPTDVFRVSKVVIENGQDGLSISERQDFPDDPDPWDQTDIGSLFSFGPYGYWLMKQHPGTRVTLGVIDRAYPHRREHKEITYFRGWLFGASDNGVFPRVKFFCRRVHPERLPKFGVMKLDGLDSLEACTYLGIPVRQREL